jgi:transcriptional regulator with XRE-family HTH domain
MGSSERPEAICSQVARILKEERERRGFSMTLLGERAGLSQQMVSYVEREMRIPSLDTLVRLCEALGLRADGVVRRAYEAADKKAE